MIDFNQNSSPSPPSSSFLATTTGTTGFQPQVPDRSTTGPQRQIAVGTTGPQGQVPGQWALTELNHQLQNAVPTARPQRQLPNRSGYYRTSTASTRPQWALPDFNRKCQIAALPDLNGRSQWALYRTSTASARSQWAVLGLNCRRQIAGPQSQGPDRSGQSWTSTASARSQVALPDLNRKC